MGRCGPGVVRRYRATVVRTAAMVGLAITMLLAAAGPAAAHADLIATSPEGGEIAELPDGRIELTFSEEVAPTGEGVRLLDRNGAVVPVSVFQPTSSTIVVEPEETLDNGGYAVIWTVQSDDGHLLNGSLSFTITSDEERSGESPPPTTAPAVSDSGEGGTTPTTVVLTPIVTSDSSGSDRTTENAAAAIMPPEPVDNRVAGLVGGVGRWITMTGALLAIGAFAFAAASLLGTEVEVRRVIGWVRWGGILVVGGTIIEILAAASMISDSPIAAMSITSLTETLDGRFGIAVLLRIVGGVAVLQDPDLVTVSPSAHGPSGVSGDGLRSESSTSQTVAVTELASPTYRLEARHEWVAMAGMAAIAVSFLFTGHTVTAEPSIVARLATEVHILAAGVWFGGLVAMAGTLVHRWRSSVELDASAMAVRFSRVAGVTLALIVAAGLTLAWTIVDSPSELVTTTWGRVLLVKVALVAIAASLGAYNHFAVVPHLQGDPHRTDVLRRVVRIEGSILLGVLAVTAVLVAAAI